MRSRGSTAAFVGRVPELSALIEAFDAAGTGRATTALVGGEAGVGKSRLVRELGAHAQHRVLRRGGAAGRADVVDSSAVDGTRAGPAPCSPGQRCVPGTPSSRRGGGTGVRAGAPPGSAGTRRRTPLGSDTEPLRE
ncbi:MAG: ATP-binding protein [Acidimicrobiales bacterium]